MKVRAQVALSLISCHALQKRYIVPDVYSGPKPTPVERRQAIEVLLASETFRRSEQLKRLLSYLYEQDELGRIHEVSEYELGTLFLADRKAFRQTPILQFARECTDCAKSWKSIIEVAQAR